MDEGVVRTVAETPAKLDAALAAERAARVALDTANRTLSTLTTHPARVGDLRAAAAGGPDAEAEIRTRTRERAEATKEVEKLTANAKTIADELPTLERSLADAKRRRDAAKATAARGPAIAAARATLAELEPQLVAAQEAVKAAEDACALAPEPPAAEPVPDVAAEEQAVLDAEKSVREYSGRVAVAERDVESAQQAAARVAALRAERQQLDAEISDWVRLEADLRALLQLSIDAAGPEIAALANELLRSPGCPSLHRYSVTVETQRPHATEKRMIEDCFVQVVDAANGYAGASAGLSDGQLAVVGEAVRFALSKIACRTAGIESPTIVRDETAGALHADIVPEYAAMLRAGAELLGAAQVLVVTHDAALAALADSVVRVHNGRITVEG